MIRLSLTPEPRWVELPPRLRLHTAPVTTAIMASARADATLDDLAPDAPKELLAVAMAKAVARRVVLNWDGVGDAFWTSGRSSRRSRMMCWAVSFCCNSKKNASEPSPNGTMAAATDIAASAGKAARTARRG